MIKPYKAKDFDASELVEVIADACNCAYADGYEEGRADAIDDVKRKMISLRTDMIFRYGADIIEARSDAFDELKDWLKEHNDGI